MVNIDNFNNYDRADTRAPRKTSPGQQMALASYPTNPVWWKQGQAACAFK
jgi:hypothetical protein